MKFVRSTLAGLYVNLFLVILSLVYLFMGMMDHNMGNWKQWLSLFALVISGVYNTVFGIINIINACKLYKNGEYNSLRKYMKVIKFGAIPYFILNFVLYFLLFALFFAASRGLIMFTPIPLFFLIPVIFTYLSVLFTSSYGVGFSFVLHKEKKFTVRKLIVHILLQLCFVLDIVDTIVLLMKYKVEKRNE